MDSIIVTRDRRKHRYFDHSFLSSSNSGWKGFYLEEAIDVNKGCLKMAFPKTTIFLCTEGTAESTWTHRGVRHSGLIRPGTIFMAKRDACIDQGSVSDDRRLISVCIDEEKLQLFDPELGYKAEESLISAFLHDDKWISALLTAMRDEIRDGCQSGDLYAQSLSLTMLSYICSRYKCGAASPIKEYKFSHSQVEKLRSYILDNLTCNISMEDLSRQSGLSITHFSRCFKSTFGISAHSFITRTKIHDAKQRLLEADHSISFIAAELGYCSQSHFTKTFGKIVGLTPSEYRRRCKS